MIFSLTQNNSTKTKTSWYFNPSRQVGGNWGLAASDSARQLLLGCSLPALGCWVLLAHCWLLLTWLVRLLLPNSGPHPDAFKSHQSVSTPKRNVVRIMYFKHQAISRRRGVIKTRWVITPYLNIFLLLGVILLKLPRTQFSMLQKCQRSVFYIFPWGNVWHHDVREICHVWVEYIF